MSLGCHERSNRRSQSENAVLCVVEEFLNVFRPLGCKVRKVSAESRQGYRNSCTEEEG